MKRPRPRSLRGHVEIPETEYERFNRVLAARWKTWREPVVVHEYSGALAGYYSSTDALLDLMKEKIETSARSIRWQIDLLMFWQPALEALENGGCRQ